MSKHTKGPWKVLPAKADRVNGGEFFPVHAGNVWIADVRYNSANALLIAAAPDLLQELQNIAKVKKQPPDLTAGEFNRRE